MESARANELDVYEYLKYLLTEMPNNHHLEDPSVIDSLLPWSKELPEQCHLKRNRKKFQQHRRGMQNLTITISAYIVFHPDHGVDPLILWDFGAP